MVTRRNAVRPGGGRPECGLSESSQRSNAMR